MYLRLLAPPKDVNSKSKFYHENYSKGTCLSKESVSRLKLQAATHGTSETVGWARSNDAVSSATLQKLVELKRHLQYQALVMPALCG